MIRGARADVLCCACEILLLMQPRNIPLQWHGKKPDNNAFELRPKFTSAAGLLRPTIWHTAAECFTSDGYLQQLWA